MADFDKIKILYIDDREEGRPEGQLPEKFDQYFTITHPYDGGGAQPFRNAKEFAPVMKEFWFDNNRNVLPAEIIVMDYNLSKWLPLGTDNRTEENIQQELADAPLPLTASIESNLENTFDEKRKINFEGLLIGVFYGSLTYEHPTGLVPMTFYSSQMPEEVETLHTLTEPFLGVDYRNFGMTHDERIWSNLIKQGLIQLRKRIINLYKNGAIDISPSDLLALQESANHRVIIIQSRYCKRKIPLDGLFIDIPEESRSAEISSYAEDIFQSVIRTDDFLKAKELADLVWGKYNQTDIIEKRWDVSRLHSQKYLHNAPLSKDDQSKLDNLYVFFGVRDGQTKNPVCGENYLDIRAGTYSDLVRRWATLLLIQRLLHRIILAAERCGGLKEKEPIFGIQAEDLYLLLFPVAQNPLILPWHGNKAGGKPYFSGMSWYSELKKWKTDSSDSLLGGGWGDLGLNLDHVLEGLGWNPIAKGAEQTFGLRVCERQILRGLMEDQGVNRNTWINYHFAKRILLGK